MSRTKTTRLTASIPLYVKQLIDKQAELEGTTAPKLASFWIEKSAREWAALSRVRTIDVCKQYQNLRELIVQNYASLLCSPLTATELDNLIEDNCSGITELQVARIAHVVDCSERSINHLREKSLKL